MTVIHHWLVDTCSLIWKKNECSPLIFDYPMATCWKVMNFGIYCSLYHVLILFFKLKKYICTFYIDIHSLKYFQGIYRSCCKVRTQFVTCKLGDCRVWTLTNPINSKPTHNSGSDVGIWTDSNRSKLANSQGPSKLRWKLMHRDRARGKQQLKSIYIDDCLDFLAALSQCFIKCKMTSGEREASTKDLQWFPLAPTIRDQWGFSSGVPFIA